MIIPAIILLLFCLCLCLAVYTLFILGGILAMLPIVIGRTIYLLVSETYTDTVQHFHESIPNMIYLCETQYQNTALLDDIAVRSQRC